MAVIRHTRWYRDREQHSAAIDAICETRDCAEEERALAGGEGFQPSRLMLD